MRGRYVIYFHFSEGHIETHPNLLPSTLTFTSCHDATDVSNAANLAFNPKREAFKKLPKEIEIELARL